MRIGIDIGGTFTDFVLFDEVSGAFRTFKLLSTPHDPAVAVVQGIEQALAESPADGLARIWIVHGSTVATNALLERNGARTALVTTAGFRDVLTIGRQIRSDIYDFFADRPEPLVPAARCFEIGERVDYQGNVLVPLATAEIPALRESLRAQEVESVAVTFLFSFLHPAHELQLARALREAGFAVSASCEVLPEFREYERASTTVVNAYVSPILDRYLGNLSAALARLPNLAAADFQVMQSNGGRIGMEQARHEAVRSILSGPAGGVVGAMHVAQVAGFEQTIAFDMGGTSTDVSLSQGALRLSTEAVIGGLPIRIPVVDIHTVGSGGGSIAHVDAGGALRVGPQSAGADPGPVCYGRGGRNPTVTDANLVLGRLAPEYFLGGELPLDLLGARQALEELAGRAQLLAHGDLDRAQTAALGVIEIANAHMERALRVISVERGYDPADFTLVSFGGAGGLHACDLARSLGIRRVLIPPGAATLSAFGMLAADVVKDYVQTVMLPGETPAAELESRLAPLAERGLSEVQAQGIPAERITVLRELDVRYVGQSYELAVPFTPNVAAEFHNAHAQRYGYAEPSAQVEIVNVRVRAIGLVAAPPLPRTAAGPPDPGAALAARQPVVLGGAIAEVPLYLGERLRPGHAIPGPAVVAQKDTTIFLPAGDLASVDEYFNVLIDVTSREPQPARGATATHALQA